MNVKNEDFFEFFRRNVWWIQIKSLPLHHQNNIIITKTMKKFIENPIQWWKLLEEDQKWLVVISALWVVCLLPYSFILALFGPIVARILW